MWELTGGNPFFLTEVLGAEHESVPGSVRDAVMGRVSRLSPPRGHWSIWFRWCRAGPSWSLWTAVLGPSEEAASEAEAAGVIVLKENASPSVTNSPAARSRRIFPRSGDGRSISRCFEAVEDLGYDVSRAAHHARVGGDVDALVRLAPLAARRAAAMESHNEAVAHLRALEPYLDQLEPEMCADHYDLWAFEEYLGSEIAWAEEIIEIGIGIRRRLDDPEKLGTLAC